MGSKVAQGTRWERWLVDRAASSVGEGVPGDRLPKRGESDEPDLWVGVHPATADRIVPVVAWHRLVKRGGKRRVPMGARRLAVLDVDDLFFLVATARRTHPGLSVVIQAKAAEQISVSTVLGGLQRWLRSSPWTKQREQHEDQTLASPDRP